MTDHLTAPQRLALEQVREITNGGEDDVAISVLSSVDWDVQRAAELIFGGAGGPPPVPPTPARPPMEQFEVDDTHQGDSETGALLPGPTPDRIHHPRPGVVGIGSMILRPIFSILTIPLHIFSNILRFVFSILRIPLPQIRFTGLNFYRRPGGPLNNTRNRRGPDRWVRDLEEETGGICIGRLKQPRGSTTGIESSGSTSLSSRSTAGTSVANDAEGRKLLPDFITCTYEELLRTCQRESKIACIILVSDEHDDVPEFKRSTLTDSNFVKTLYDNDILVWGGDVRDQEAWSASEKLQATTYPFVAFLALQPARTPRTSSNTSSSPTPTLTILSRHQGPSYPLSTAPTSPQTLTAHLTTQLLPRVTPFLSRLLSIQKQREYDRSLREEQDRAFQSAAERDRQRIEARMASERAQIEARRLAEEEARIAAQRVALEAEAKRQREKIRMDMRRWTRAVVLPSFTSTSGGGTRIAIRLPSGTRLVHTFGPTSTLTTLYAFVDTQSIPPDLSSSSDPLSMPGTQGEQGNIESLETYISQQGTSYWGFQILTAYPRIEIPWLPGAQHKLSDIQHLKGGGQIVVEGLGPVQRDGEEEDGYDTEESE